MPNPFKTRVQCIAFLGVCVAVGFSCAASIAVAEIFMPENAAGQQGVATFYRTFTPMAVVWTLLGIWAHACMPPRVCGPDDTESREGAGPLPQTATR
ncbi:hypothetical protein [Rhodopirellula islandica]|nr:hypothetical protein [Rhodopirellula islandica]